MFEDTEGINRSRKLKEREHKGINRSRKSKKEREHNGMKVKRKVQIDK